MVYIFIQQDVRYKGITCHSWIRSSNILDSNNPNGKYHIGTEQVKTCRPKRENSLKAKIDELCSPDYIPENQVNIHYMYYDLITPEIGPEIMTDRDFPDATRMCNMVCLNFQKEPLETCQPKYTRHLFSKHNFRE